MTGVGKYKKEKERRQEIEPSRGTWVAQSVKHPTSAQVTISQFVSSSPVSGSVLIAKGLEPASDSVSPFLSAPFPSCALSLSLSKINIKKKKPINCKTLALKIQKRRKM